MFVYIELCKIYNYYLQDAAGFSSFHQISPRQMQNIQTNRKFSQWHKRLMIKQMIIKCQFARIMCRGQASASALTDSIKLSLVKYIYIWQTNHELTHYIYNNHYLEGHVCQPLASSTRCQPAAID